MSNLNAALFYLKELNLSIIPIKIWNSKTEKKWMKTPAIKEWKSYQTNLPTEDEIKDWFSDPKNQIAIITGEINNLYVFDLDFYAMKAEERIKAEALLPDSFETLIAKTPSGGQHIYCSKPLAVGSKIRGFSGGKDGSHGLPPWVDLRGDGNMIIAPPSTRPDGAAYEFINGQVKKGAWSLIQQIPINIYNIIIPYVEKENRDNGDRPEDNKRLTDKLTISLQEGRRNESLNKILFHAYKGGLNFQDGTYLANFIGRNSLNKDGNKRLEIEPKTVEATNLSAWRGSHNISFAEEVREWVSLQTAYFKLTDFRSFLGNAYNQLTRDERKNLYVIMNRLTDQELIEKHPSQSGCYRKRDQTIKEIDLEEDPGKEWEITFPLGIDDLIHTYPKGIIVVYSSPDGGKSAFLFDFMKRNMDKFTNRIHYFSSEMGGQELGDRLSKFGISIKEWKKSIKFWERSRNFADAVKPEDINIIDFLAVHEDFSLVGKYIDGIWERLIGGIAIVVLQSKYNSDLPRGAEFALEKARLAFTLLQKEKHHLCKITKAKNWKNDLMNPNRKVKKFTIFKGCQITGKGDWMTEDQYETLEGERNSL